MDDNKPSVDASGKGLGVRGALVNGVADVDLDELDRVILNGKGMSVAPSLRDLPAFLIPERLRDRIPKARGKSDLHCFAMGKGAFADGPAEEGLVLIVDSPRHGVVAPAQPMSIDQYQIHLSDTRDRWTIDEA